MSGERSSPGEGGASHSGEGHSEPLVHAAPGVAALFEGLTPGGGHSILELGPAGQAHFNLYSGFARRIRFAGLLPEPPRGEALARALDELEPHPDHPYDVVLAWNVLDRLGSVGRSQLLERLDHVTAPGARLHTVVDASGRYIAAPIRFTLLALDRVAQEEVGAPERARPELLPAELERMLAPFEVVRAFTLRIGMREYLAVKESP